MKKFLLCILAVLMIIPSLAFVGCKSDDAINMNRYFKENIEYSLYGSGSVYNDLKLSSFLDDKADNLNQYWSLTFTCEESWIYKLFLEKVSFDVYSNTTMEVQFIITIKNLKKGDPTGSYDDFTQVIPASLKANKAVMVEFDVNDYFQSYINSAYIKIAVQDRSYFEADGEKTNFKYDILNLQFYGKHNASYKD